MNSLILETENRRRFPLCYDDEIKDRGSCLFGNRQYNKPWALQGDGGNADMSARARARVNASI